MVWSDRQGDIRRVASATRRDPGLHPQREWQFADVCIGSEGPVERLAGPATTLSSQDAVELERGRERARPQLGGEELTRTLRQYLGDYPAVSR
jgi:hypothetical protein